MKEKNDNKLITIEELSKISGEKLKNLSSYIRKGILFYEEENANGTRYYNKDEALENIKEIKRLQKEGYTSKDMNKFLSKKHLFKKIEELQEK